MKIGILGVGKLGLCFALNLERAGFKVTGVDISEEYVSQLNQRNDISYEPGVTSLLKGSKNFLATTSTKEVLSDEFELLFVMVATPSLPDGSYDHSQIERVAAEFRGRTGNQLPGEIGRGRPQRGTGSSPFDAGYRDC